MPQFVPDVSVNSTRDDEWVEEIRRLFLSSDPLPAIGVDSCPSLATAVDRVAPGALAQVSIADLLVEAVERADEQERQSEEPTRDGSAFRAGALGYLALCEPTRSQLSRLSGMNGRTPRWPSAAARQAWAFYRQQEVRRNHEGPPSGASAGSGKNYRARYEAAICDAVRLMLRDSYAIENVSRGVSKEQSDTRWLECEIHQRVLAVDTVRRSYILRTEFRLTCEMHIVRLAQTCDEVSSDWVCAEFPMIMDIFTIVSNGSITFSLQWKEVSDRSPWRTAQFRPDLHLMAEMFREFPELESHDLRVWKADLAGESGMKHLAISCDFELPLDDPCFYWTAPQPVWLKRVHVDVSTLLPHMVGQLEVLTKIASRPSIRIDRTMGTCDVELNAWVQAGSSVEIRWDGK